MRKNVRRRLKFFTGAKNDRRPLKNGKKAVAKTARGRASGKKKRPPAFKIVLRSLNSTVQDVLKTVRDRVAVNLCYNALGIIN